MYWHQVIHKEYIDVANKYQFLGFNFQKSKFQDQCKFLLETKCDIIDQDELPF